MAYSNERLNDIFDKTDGYCHICDLKLAFSRYGDIGHQAGWEVDHSVPKAKGGTDHLNNLWPAHTSCNRSKGSFSTRTARSWYGEDDSPNIVPALLQAIVFGGIIYLLWKSNANSRETYAKK